MLKDSSYAFAEVRFRTKLYLLDEVWRKGVLMDDGEEDEEELDHTNIIAQYGAFVDDAVGGDDEEDAVAAEDLVKEIIILGPMFLYTMFPFERFIGVLKKYVHSRSQPEGSIAQGYGTEEVIEFWVDFILDIDPIGVPES